MFYSLTPVQVVMGRVQWVIKLILTELFENCVTHGPGALHFADERLEKDVRACTCTGTSIRSR